MLWSWSRLHKCCNCYSDTVVMKILSQFWAAPTLQMTSCTPVPTLMDKHTFKELVWWCIIQNCPERCRSEALLQNNLLKDVRIIGAPIEVAFMAMVALYPTIRRYFLIPCKPRLGKRYIRSKERKHWFLCLWRYLSSTHCPSKKGQEGTPVSIKFAGVNWYVQVQM